MTKIQSVIDQYKRLGVVRVLYDPTLAPRAHYATQTTTTEKARWYISEAAREMGVRVSTHNRKGYVLGHPRPAVGIVGRCLCEEE